MAERGGPIDATGARVLVVDGDDQGAELTKRLFAREGFEVDRARDGDDALAQLIGSKPRFACVVIDLDAGGAGSSLDLLERIRTGDEASITTTRVVICANVDASRLLSWKSGADGFLARPFHASELLDTVHAALERSDAERLSYRQVQAGLTANN